MITSLYLEKFLGSGNIYNYGYIEVFINPSESEMRSLHNRARGFIDSKGNLYVWSIDLTHNPGLDFLNKNKFVDNPDYINSKGMTIIIIYNNIYLGESITNDEIREYKKYIISYMDLCKQKNSRFSFNPVRENYRYE